MKKIFYTCFIAVNMIIMNASKVQAELIVLAAPIAENSYYYKPVESDIFDFHIAYAKQIAKHDDVLILTDKSRYSDYVKALGKDKVAIAPMRDIWMRDFSLSNATNPIMFRYTSEAQGAGEKGQQDADAVQESFAQLVSSAGLLFLESDLLNDGGNFVDDYAGNVVVSTKFLKDNALSEDEARARLTALPNIKHVAFIEADEQGGLEHADGVVSFVDTNTLIINSYPQDTPYSKQLKADLRRGLPSVIIHDIVTPYDDNKVYDARFGSACGLYTNALVTPERIYLPQFGIPEDKVALEQVKAITSREVIPVISNKVCQMGGGVRCMSWQLRGENAKRMLNYFVRTQ